jgi:phosphatidylethanolamine/phosphatidyl-N-methylethanolamine N-methyltransferase
MLNANAPTTSSATLIPQLYSIISGVNNWCCESAVFAWQFIWNPKTLGTPFTLSSYVAEQLLSHMDGAEKIYPRNYLEVGAGTGAMTGHILKKLKPHDTLHLVEINPQLCALLKSKYEKIANVFIHNCPIQTFFQSEDQPFDVIISTIPLNSFSSPEDVNTILNTYKKFVKPNGIISFAEYVGTSTAASWTHYGQASQSYSALQKIKAAFFQTHGIETKIVYANIPPARVIHCRINTSKQI